MDELDSLPIDNKKKASVSEMKILKKYFGDQKKSKRVWEEVKEVLVATILFVLMSTNFFEKCLDYVPHTDSSIMRLVVKAIIYAVLLYLIIIMIN